MFSNIFAADLKKVRIQYPSIDDGWSIEMMGLSIDELTTDAVEIANRANHLETEEGDFPGTAIEKAVEENVIEVEAPPGHIFARLVKPGQKPILVTLKVSQNG
jgi:hypothetical protein